MKLHSLALIFGLCIFSHFLEAEEQNYKESIVRQKQAVAQALSQEKGAQLKALAILYLKDQDQEQAFSAFLEALNLIKNDSAPSQNDADALFQKALQFYLKNGENSPKSTAEQLIEEFLPQIKAENVSSHPFLNYLIAIAYANLGNYEEFFNFFFDAFSTNSHHFLAYKTIAILHVKLMERKRTNEERMLHRNCVLENIKKAIKLEPNDTSLYKLLIAFSLQNNKKEQVQLCLNEIVVGNIIIPRNDLLFYTQESVNIGETTLAQKFIDKAREWYPHSRIVASAQNYLDRAIGEPHD